MSFLWGPLIPLFWTSGDIYPGFQCQSGQPYSYLAEACVMYVPKDYVFIMFVDFTGWVRDYV